MMISLSPTIIINRVGAILNCPSFDFLLCAFSNTSNRIVSSMSMCLLLTFTNYQICAIIVSAPPSSLFLNEILSTQEVNGFGGVNFFA